jgi:hypothetical protein
MDDVPAHPAPGTTTSATVRARDDHETEGKADQDTPVPVWTESMEVEVRPVAPETGQDAITHRRTVAVAGQFFQLIARLRILVEFPAIRVAVQRQLVALYVHRLIGRFIRPQAFAGRAGGPQKWGDDRMFDHGSAPGLACPIASATWTYNRLRRTVCRIPPLRK